VIATDFGNVAVYGPVVIGVGEQCGALWAAWDDDAYQRDDDGRRGDPTHLVDESSPESSSPIADLLGVGPPDGNFDWYFTCAPTVPLH
jgi:hypothetical protein